MDVGELLGALDLGMRRQDLLEQGGARARQAQDEDRVGPGVAPALSRPEEAGIADLLLQTGVGLHDRRGIAAGLAAQAVAVIVPVPGAGEVAAVLQRLAEGEAEVGPVFHASVRVGRLSAHRVDLGGAEAIGLEVRQAPVGVAEVGPGGRRRAIGLDRLGQAPHGLKRVAQPKGHVPGRRGVRPHAAIDRDGALVLADADGRGRRQGAVVRVIGVEVEQGVDLFACGGVLLPLQQGLGVFVAGGPVVRRQGEHRRQQGLGFVEHVVRQRNAGEQAHRVGLIALAQQKGADDLLRRR